jgi:hypothetical protein
MELPGNREKIQQLCQAGQQQLQEMLYLQAESSLAAAEQLAWESQDWDALARLYMPLQESRRQRRQRCAEGMIRLDLIARGKGDRIDGAAAVEDCRQGQLLIAGWESIQPAVQARRYREKHGLYVDVFLAAVYSDQSVVIVPDEHETTPTHKLIIAGAALKPTVETAAELWQRLHEPFLAAAEAIADPIKRIAEYRRTIEVDYACELAHQGTSAAARQLCSSPSRA